MYPGGWLETPGIEAIQCPNDRTASIGSITLDGRATTARTAKLPR